MTWDPTMPLFHVLALDQSPRRIGFAIGSSAMQAPITGVFALPMVGAWHGIMLGKARDWLDTHIKVYHITKVCFETPFFPASGGAKATWGVMNKLIGVIELVCDDHEIKCVETTPDNWRRHFLGLCRAPKDIPKLQRRTWLKDRAVRACSARGWQVKTDDEADACGILSYVLSLDAEAKAREAA